MTKKSIIPSHNVGFRFTIFCATNFQFICSPQKLEKKNIIKITTTMIRAFSANSVPDNVWNLNHPKQWYLSTPSVPLKTSKSGICPVPLKNFIFIAVAQELHKS